ncbi:class I lanthipeptide [Flavobacterium hydatis]|jgi:hypothetical protein|uniref:class I lanthipeptide n=1 Tax=Flavobacterium hydatis TaxID=991 RepID=UPI000A60D306|nr:class I lanthipeptide [Flavobacterium hydatis]
MKKIKTKKLVLKKTNIIELNSEEARLIVGGGATDAIDITDPRSMYSMFCGS